MPQHFVMCETHKEIFDDPERALFPVINTAELILSPYTYRFAVVILRKIWVRKGFQKFIDGTMRDPGTASLVVGRIYFRSESVSRVSRRRSKCESIKPFGPRLFRTCSVWDLFVP